MVLFIFMRFHINIPVLGTEIGELPREVLQFAFINSPLFLADIL